MNSEFLSLGLWAMALQIAFEFLPFMGLRLWKYRTYFAGFSAVLIGFSSGFVVVSVAWPLAVVFILIQMFRLINLLRIVKGRINENDLWQRAVRSSLVLLLCMGLLLGYYYVSTQYPIDTTLVIAAEVLLQLCIATVLFVHTVLALKKMRIPQEQSFLSDGELSTLTIAIPARNETNDLTDCLQSLLASDYPKLEILVLDDCSQDNTSDIIRGFAHRGVRFLKGTAPGADWLAKNHASEQLFEEANGEIILFCGVDVRFDKHSLRKLVGLLRSQQLTMLSVLPRRGVELNRHFLLQPMRYWREIVLPRVFRRTPPALSTCWMAERKALQAAGDFDAYKRAIRPEYFFARLFDSQNKYHFYQGSTDLGVTSIKNAAAQWQTAVRTRYPEFHQHIETVFLWTIIELFVFALPIGNLIYGLVQGNRFIWITELLVLIILLAIHMLILRATTNRWSLSWLLNLPFVIAAEIFVMNYSMWRYEFSDVLWKGRNVCMPVLRGISSLPKI